MPLSDTQMKYLALAWQCFETEPKIDYNKFHQVAGLASANSARELMRVTKNKLKAEYGALSGGVQAQNAGTPKKNGGGSAASASGTPKKDGGSAASTANRAASTNGAGSANGTPAPSTKKRGRKPAAAKENGDVGCDEEESPTKKTKKGGMAIKEEPVVEDGLEDFVFQ